MCGSVAKKLLIYAQDVGGGRFILPVVKEIIAKRSAPETVVLVHPLSHPLFRKENIAHQKLEDAIKVVPAASETWETYLKEHNIERVFCTTSSPYRDLSNGHLIAAAHDLGIPTLGVMDHWKGYDRFFKEGEPCWCPDHICCIDDSCVQKLCDIGCRADRIHVVGHPYLERICTESRGAGSIGNTIRVLFVSQPITSDESFKGIFFVKVGGRRLTDEITDVIEMNSAHFAVPDRKVRMYLRPHPKEQPVEKLPEGVEIDPFPEWDTSLREHHVFVGMDSMALVEAGLAGKQCITLNMPELSFLSDGSAPFAYAKKVSNPAGIADALEAAVAAAGAPDGNESPCPEFLHDSTQRTIGVVERFINKKI